MNPPAQVTGVLTCFRAICAGKRLMEGDGKLKKAEKKPGSGGFTFGELVAAIREAEYNSIREIGGKGGQVWLDPKRGKVWATDFAPGDRYLKTEREINGKQKTPIRVLLWNRESFYMALQFDEIPEIDSAEWDRFLSMYFRGVYPDRFDPVAIAKKICADRGI